MDHDTPAIHRGQIWRPRGLASAREVLDCSAEPSGEVIVRYRMQNADFAVSIGNFRFWISRLSASLED